VCFGTVASYNKVRGCKIMAKNSVDTENLNIPNHVAIIMDGNGRWAKKRLLPRTAGHKKGAAVVEQIIEDAADLGIKYLTVYAFSTENWKRPKEEVDTLMDLLGNYLTNCIEKSEKNRVRIRVIGDKSALRKDLVDKIEELERISEQYDRITFTIALNYGSRDEMVRAMKKMAKEIENGDVKSEDIDEKKFEEYLDTKGMPDPDLLIRTSGEERLSNYLLWQLAYTEFYFTDVLWPDFNKEELINAIVKYNGRERRYGGIK